MQGQGRGERKGGEQAKNKKSTTFSRGGSTHHLPVLNQTGKKKDKGELGDTADIRCFGFGGGLSHLWSSPPAKKLLGRELLKKGHRKSAESEP